MTNFKIKIINPGGTVLEADVVSVTLDTIDGQITVLANHLPIISALGKGEIVVKTETTTYPFFVWGGFVEFSNNTLVVLAHSAEYVEKIDFDSVQKAKEDAERLLEGVELVSPEYQVLLDKLNKEKKKIELFNKWKS